MNDRTISLIQNIESIISARPEYAPEIISVLTALLETRDMEHYLDNSGVILKMLEDWLNKKAGIPENSDVTVDVDFSALKDIAGEFHPLTAKDADDVAAYLDTIFRRHSDLLQTYLSDRLGVPAKSRSPKNFREDKMKIWFLMSSIHNCDNVEDFFLELPASVSQQSVIALVHEFYESRGYTLCPVETLGFMVRNSKESFCVVLTRTDILQVTVNASIKH